MRRERGSAPVEFVLVGGFLLVPLFLGIVQLGLVLHMRNVVAASAAEAARTAANADRLPRDGEVRAREFVGDALSSDVAEALSYDGRQTRDASGVVVVEVRVRGPLPLTFLPFGSVSVDVVGHAVKEGQ